jgi:CheY-like chemotaxis protein
VISASNADEAIALFRTHGPAIRLLVTDVVMPGMDGLELCTRIREARPDLPVLFVSGYTREATLPLDVEGPVTRFLQKPFTTHALLQAVEDMLDVKTES